MNHRTSEIERKTRETEIRLRLDLDGSGRAEIATGIGFFDHMLDSFARHARFDIELEAKGDLEVDGHHTVEDVGIVLGQAIDRALGDRRGIERFASVRLPMDESLAVADLDLSGRGLLCYRHDTAGERIGSFPVELAEEFFRALAHNSRTTLHLELLVGRDAHHRLEALFKAAARAFRRATRIDPDHPQEIPSTKGTLD
jgi:imidazoleglycerol-phosphate dehydratase